MIRFLALVVFATATLNAQSTADRKCETEFTSPYATSSYRTTSATGKQMVYFSGFVEAICVGTDMRLSGDSLAYIEDAGLMTVIGHAKYTENGAEITANMLQYFEKEAHILATGDVHIKTKSNSTLTSQQANYYRPLPGVRPSAEAFAIGGRPHAELRDSVGSKDTTVTLIDADHIAMKQDSLFYAGGKSVITRPDLVAKADSIETNSSSQTMRLRGGNPHVQGAGDSKFTLDGTLLDVFGKQRAISRLLAQGKAVAVNDSLKLTADTLDIRLANSKIDSVAAWGGGVAHATSPDRDIRGKRIHLSMPGGRLQRLFTVGSARAETKPDTSAHTTERDWIEGDTIRATFALPKDTTKQPQLQTVIAVGKARSFYHAAPDGKAKADTVGGVNYAAGSRIDIVLKVNGKQDVHVTGQVHGISLEAEKKDTTSAKSTAKPKKPPPRGGTP